MKSKIKKSSPELLALLRRVESVFGRAVVVPNDFDALSDALKNTISSPTLKRIFGYVRGYDVVRVSTLNILATYVGYTSWEDFLNICRTEHGVESQELHTKVINSEHLAVNEVIEFAWLPNRICRCQYLGNSRFEVIYVENSKLAVGDTFSCRMFALGETLYIDNLKQAETLHAVYAIGIDNGLASVRVVRS